MPKTGIPSPARSQGAPVTPRRYRPRGPRSAGSPARSDVSGRLTSIIKTHKNLSKLSPMPNRRSVLTDNTDIEDPKRRSWWKQLGENSREMMEVIENNKVSTDTEYNVEELIEMEVLSQEKKSYHLDLPESSGSESIHSIVMPQRKLFKQKEIEPQKKFGELVHNRETLPKLHKTSSRDDKSINVGTRELFQRNKQRSKPIFPAALLDISLNKTGANKTKENINEPPKNQMRNIFGNRAPTKRRNMFAEFIVSESEDEILEIQPKVFGFPQKSNPKRRGSTSRGMREPSPASSITTDMEMDDWIQLPSSTMVAEQLEEVVSGTPVKRARLSKLSEAIESDAGNNISTTDKTKQSNKSTASKNRSKNSSAIKIRSLEINRSMTTRNAAKNMQNNIATDNNAAETSFMTKNTSKSKNSNSSLNSRNSKKTDHSLSSINNKNQTLEITNQHMSKGKTFNFEKNKDNLIENNGEIDDNNVNEEINFTLEYESDDQQETVALHIDNKSIKNKTVTFRRESKETNVDASPKKQEQNMTLKKLHSTKKTVNECEEIEMSKESKLVSADMRSNDISNRAQQDVSKEVSRDTQDKLKIVDGNNHMDLDEQDVNEMQIQDEIVDQQMVVDEIDCVIQRKEISNKTVDNTHKSMEVNNQKQNDCQKERETVNGSQEIQCASQVNVERKNLLQSKEIHEDINAQNKIQHDQDEVVNRDVENSPIMIQEENFENDKNGKQKPQNVEALDKSKLSNESKKNDVGQIIHNTNQDIENEVVKEIRNEAKAIDQATGREKDKRDEIEAEENNENEIIEQNSREIGEQNASEAEAQNERYNEDHNETEEHDECAVEQNEIEGEEHDESEAKEQDESEIEESNKSAFEELAHSGLKQQDEIEENVQNEVEEQNDSEGEEQNDSEVVEQNYSEIEGQNGSEVEEQDESEVEEQDDSQVEEQNDKEGEERNDSEVEAQNDSEVGEQNASEIEEENDSDEEEQNESNPDEQSDGEEESQSQSQEETHNVSKEAEHNTNQEESEDVIEQTETLNSSGINSLEAVLHNRTNQGDSFTVKGRNTSIHKSKSIIRPLDIQPSLAPPRHSTGFSDGTKNSSAEGSGWDSHRTTRKTMRQTFGRDFSPRKSLRALVMEKSTKRKTAYLEGRAEITSLPQANSTEFPEMSNRYDDVEETMESDHELSRKTRQATLEMCLEQIKKKNMERWEREKEKVRNMFTTSNKENKRFKEPRPMFETKRTKKQVKTNNKKDKQAASSMPMDYFPPELLEDMKYKPPKRFQPTNASWTTKRLYKFLETKLEPKYDYKARVRAEKLVETIYNFTKSLKRNQVAPIDAVDVLKHEMARLDIVKTHFDFYQFFVNYMPREIRIKVIPDIVNKIPMPKHGIFSDILH